MPNHVRNYLTAIGAEGDVNRFVARARGRMPKTGDTEGPNAQIGAERPEEALCFHSLVPLPPEYSQVCYGSGGTLQGIDMEREAWGVKWGAYDPAEPHLKPGLVTYKFTTAWSPPDVWLAKVSKDWPELRFFLSWGGEGPTRGRVAAHGGAMKIEEDRYVEGQYPNSDWFFDDDEAFSEAYDAAEHLRLYDHYPWIARQR